MLRVNGERERVEDKGSVTVDKEENAGAGLKRLRGSNSEMKRHEHGI